MLDYLPKFLPEIISIVIGFLLRHFLMPIISGKEISTLIKYLKTHEQTKEEQAKLDLNLAQTQLWLELHANSCPYVKKELREAKELTKKIFNQGKK